MHEFTKAYFEIRLGKVWQAICKDFKSNKSPKHVPIFFSITFWTVFRNTVIYLLEIVPRKSENNIQPFSLTITAFSVSLLHIFFIFDKITKIFLSLCSKMTKRSKWIQGNGCFCKGFSRLQKSSSTAPVKKKPSIAMGAVSSVIC